jgi:hypothetical protein
MSLAATDEAGPEQLCPLIGAFADAVSDRRYRFDISSYVAELRRAMIASGERRLPFLADGASQTFNYIVLLDEVLARSLPDRKLLALHL